MTYLRGLALAGAVLVAACGGSNDKGDGNGNPVGPTPGGSTCRELASDFAAQTTAGSFSATTNSTCSFSASSRVVSCTHRYTDNEGGSTTTTGTAQYASVADLVDEVAVVPPRTYVTTVSVSLTGSSSGSGSVTYTYDSNRRLAQATTAASSGTATTTYTAWDAAGRPTAGTDAGPGFSNTWTIVYDAAARTRTTRVNDSAVVTVETFDANGNLARQVSTSGSSTTTANYTTRATQRICR